MTLHCTIRTLHLYCHHFARCTRTYRPTCTRRSSMYRDCPQPVSHTNSVRVCPSCRSSHVWSVSKKHATGVTDTGGEGGGRGGRGSDLFEMCYVFRKHANLWDAPLANNWSNYDVQGGPSQVAEHYLWTSRFYNHVLGVRFRYKMIRVMYGILRFLFISSAAVVQPRAVGITFIIMSLQNRAAVTDLPYKVGGIRVRLP